MQIRNYIILLAMLILGGCIKPYQPEFKTEATQRYVVQGMVTNQEGWQEVNISVSSSLTDPGFIPLNGCEVEIIDDLNQRFSLDDDGQGNYKVWMSAEYLVIGRSYKLGIHLPNGEVLESSFDQMQEVPEVDEVYYEIKEIPTSDPDENQMGIQIYIDLEATENQSKYYRWRLSETWEYHAAYPKEFYFDGMVQQVIPPDYSLMYCWKTQFVDEIYTLSTKNLTENSYTKFPLQYISNETDRLAIMYSMYIQQIALSEEAYTFWDQLRENNSIGEGLYGEQPMAIQGNIVNISKPDHKVLGFFQASSISTKRVFIEPVDHLVLDFSDGCSPRDLLKGLSEISPYMYPVHLMTVNGTWVPTLLSNSCIDCTILGGSIEKPNFWPYKEK